jgi:hypothetical protein
MDGRIGTLVKPVPGAAGSLPIIAVAAAELAVDEAVMAQW